jgi:hypothetical protein
MHNLSSVCELLEGVDERTWLIHLWHGDYTIERRYELPAADSRQRVRGAIAHRYALPA